VLREKADVDRERAEAGEVGGVGKVGLVKKMAGIVKEKGTEMAIDAVKHAAYAWVLNAVLMVALVLIVVVVAFLYFTSRSGAKPSKAI
jgi:hypothetical protein